MIDLPDLWLPRREIIRPRRPFDRPVDGRRYIEQFGQAQPCCFECETPDMSEAPNTIYLDVDGLTAGCTSDDCDDLNGTYTLSRAGLGSADPYWRLISNPWFCYDYWGPGVDVFVQGFYAHIFCVKDGNSDDWPKSHTNGLSTQWCELTGLSNGWYMLASIDFVEYQYLNTRDIFFLAELPAPVPTTWKTNWDNNWMGFPVSLSRWTCTPNVCDDGSATVRDS